MGESQWQDFELAENIEGIDYEIAVLRVKLKSILEKDPDNMVLITRTTNAMDRLVRTRFKIGKGDNKGLREALQTVMRDIAIPTGFDPRKLLGERN